jgi:hypothetical protein
MAENRYFFILIETIVLWRSKNNVKRAPIDRRRTTERGITGIQTALKLQVYLSGMKL